MKLKKVNMQKNEETFSNIKFSKTKKNMLQNLENMKVYFRIP